MTDCVLKRYARAGNLNDWVALLEEIAQAGAMKLWVGIGGGGLAPQLLAAMRLLGAQVMVRFVREYCDGLAASCRGRPVSGALAPETGAGDGSAFHQRP